MIADTTFLIHLVREKERGISGPARMFLASHRTQRVRTSIISLSELAPSFRTTEAAWEYFKRWPVYRLHDQKGQVYSLIPLKNPSGRPGLFFRFEGGWRRGQAHQAQV
jgi:hypothetical protein